VNGCRDRDQFWSIQIGSETDYDYDYDYDNDNDYDYEEDRRRKPISGCWLTPHLTKHHPRLQEE